MCSAKVGTCSWNTCFGPCNEHQEVESQSTRLDIHLETRNRIGPAPATPRLTGPPLTPAREGPSVAGEQACQEQALPNRAMIYPTVAAAGRAAPGGTPAAAQSKASAYLMNGNSTGALDGAGTRPARIPRSSGEGRSASGRPPRSPCQQTSPPGRAFPPPPLAGATSLFGPVYKRPAVTGEVAVF